jgi:DNA-binding CsgD family transcriptional regulator
MSLMRERLAALLTEQALTSVELVIAPPGYGKSTVLRDYSARDPEAAFVALPDDTDLETFVREVIAAAAPSAARSVGGVFDGRTGSELEEHVGTWLVSRLRVFTGTLVIDDFHRAAGDERVARVLIATIAATHGRMRWIIASREAPRFPMGSWIARGWMGLPISGEDLRFTAEEAAALAASLDIDATPEDIDAIVRDTLGWPIGVRLALGLVARKRVPGQTRMQTRDALFALINDEVWEPLEPEFQRILTAAASIPSPAIATLVAAGFDDALALMTSIFARVPFVTPLDDDAFTIHDLFREFVVSRRPADAADDVATRIGAGLVNTGNPADGLRLLIAAGRVDDVEATLGKHAFDLLEMGYRPVVSAALAFLNDHGRTDGGVSLAVRGALALADGSAGNAATLWSRALTRQLTPQLHGDVSRRLAMNYLQRQMWAEAHAIVESVLADGSLSIDDRLEVGAIALMMAHSRGTSANDVRNTIMSIEAQLPAVNPKTQVRIKQRLGYAAYTIGDSANAERFAQDAALLATSLGMDTVAALAYGVLFSVAALVDGDTQRARSILRSQSAAAERAGNNALRVYALRGEYSLAAFNAEPAEADAIETTLGTLVDARTYRDTFVFRSARALRFVATSESRRAAATLKSLPMANTSATERAYHSALMTVLALINGDRAVAAESVERGLMVEASGDYWDRAQLSRAYALRGVAFWALGRPAQARKSFQIDTLTLARRDRILVDGFRALVELPYPVPNIAAIDALCKPLLEADFGSYVALIRALVAQNANDVMLSAAEIETLRVFDRYGGRAADVAQALGKSKYTVQNQIQSAIRKLGCSGRAEALAYARKRGWLDTTS